VAREESLHVRRKQEWKLSIRPSAFLACSRTLDHTFISSQLNYWGKRYRDAHQTTQETPIEYKSQRWYDDRYSQLSSRLITPSASHQGGSTQPNLLPRNQRPASLDSSPDSHASSSALPSLSATRLSRISQPSSSSTSSQPSCQSWAWPQPSTTRAGYHLTSAKASGSQRESRGLGGI